MKKIAIAAILLTGCFQYSFAQTDATVPDTKKEKSTDQYIGVQMNDLIRQVFNFNNSAASTNPNPYLLNYSINSRKTGWGVRVGIGYNYNSSSTNDGITNTTTKLNDMQFRIGVEKAFKLSEKWSAGAGLDIVYNSNDDHTLSTVNASFGGVGETTDTHTTISSYGGGPQAWLRYHITPKILIGTEASFYYVTGNQTTSINISGNNGGPTNNQPDQSNDVSQGTFSSPIVFFLLVKF